MLRVAHTEFIGPAVITKPIDDSLFTWENIQYFDNDGFQLSKLEQEFYKANGVELNYINGVWGAQTPWIIGNDPNFVVDHSMLITRCCYSGEALAQIKRFATPDKFPYLLKYTKIKPKWGIDFALEYFKGDDFMEVLHIELDFHDLSTARTIKGFYEHRIVTADWQEFADGLINLKHEWVVLDGMERNNWKARFWGMTKAENIHKVV